MMFLWVMMGAATIWGADQASTPQKFKVILKTGETVVVDNGTLTDTGLTGTQVTNSVTRTISKPEMVALYRAAGKDFGGGVLMGAICGFGGSTLGCLWMGVIDPPKTYRWNYNYTVLEQKSTPITAGEFITIVGVSTAVGAGIGLIVGNFATKWDRLPLSIAVDLNDSKSVRLSYHTTF